MILTLFSLVPDTGNTVHPNSAVAVVESIKVSVVKMKKKKKVKTYVKITLCTTQRPLWLPAMLGNQASDHNSLITRRLRR